MILGMIGKTVRGVRRLRGRALRESVRDYVDEALASYGYSRRMGGLAGVVPLAGAFGAGVAVGTGSACWSRRGAARRRASCSAGGCAISRRR
ncbi:MAG: hypothetical protein M5U28_16350 [Sandaracinaceae bacterium]|nr:hypothetical protein [Sandaracinaceae bacterium]